MAGRIPTEEEVLGYFESLSNWGRWGGDDELGTYNLITPEKTRRATQLVQEGVTVSCARTVTYEPSPDTLAPAVHFMTESGEGLASGEKAGLTDRAYSADFFGMMYHTHVITHIDSLAHIFWQGKMYNGRPAHLVSTSQGATVESIELIKDSIVTRGVLVDVPMIRGIDWMPLGEGVMPQDIEAAEERCGFRVEQGDVLLVRTGELKRRNTQGPVNHWDEGSTACHAACLPLLRERDITVLGTDTGNDVIPSDYPRIGIPVHSVGIVAMGLWMLDCANLENLAQACLERNRWEFLISISPLRLSNATGSPVNPVAVF